MPKPLPELTPEQKAQAEEGLKKYLELRRLLPHSSCRVPDWRWQIVPKITEYPFLKRHLRHDPGIKIARQLYKYLQHLNSMGPRKSRRKPPPEAVLEAYTLYDRPLNRQAELKTRLLAKEPVPIIAQKINATPEAITWYEQLFFNIADRLKADSYIRHCVTQLRDLKPDHPRFYSAFLMEMGYCAGAPMVDRLVPLLPRITEPLLPEDYRPTADPEESFLRSVKRFIEVRSTMFGPYDEGLILNIRGWIELKQRNEQAAQLAQQMQAMEALAHPLAGSSLLENHAVAEEELSGDDAMDTVEEQYLWEDPIYGEWEQEAVLKVAS